VYRAFQEALGYGIRHNLETLRETGIEAQRILAIGSIAKSRSLIQVISDICGCPQLVPREKTGASYGDAFLAAQGTGYFPDVSGIKDWVEYEDDINPNPEYRDFYAEGFKKFRELYKALENFM
jgi:xylulokinase